MSDKKESCYAKWSGDIKGWVSYCPELDLISQGTTEAQALASLSDTITLWALTCYEKGTLLRNMETRLECAKKAKASSRA